MEGGGEKGVGSSLAFFIFLNLGFGDVYKRRFFP